MYTPVKTLPPYKVLQFSFPVKPFPDPQPQATTDLLSMTMKYFCLFSNVRVWFLSLITVFLRFSHVVCLSGLLLFIAQQNSVVLKLTNKQNRNKLIGTKNKLMITKRDGGGSWMKKVKGLRSTNQQLQNSHGGVKCSIVNIVNDTTNGVRRVLAQ